MKKSVFLLITALLLIMPAVSAVTLEKPRFGAADSAAFNVTVTTASAATCRYSGINLPFEQMNAFDETGALSHTKTGVTLSAPETGTDFFVNCSAGSAFEAGKFELKFDLTNPVISKISADPAPVVDAPLETTITLDASEKVFCKYGLTHIYYDMAAVFGEETTNTSYKAQHVFSLTSLQDNKKYNYAFMCRDLANRTAAVKNLTLVVNTSITPAIEWVKPETGSYLPSQLINLSVKTNKKSTCKYGNVSDGITSQAGDFNTEKNNHTAEISVAGGKQTYYAKCGFASLDSLTDSTSFTVDQTAPALLLVNDSSGTAKPEYSPYLDKLRYSFNAEDNESGIKLYNFSIWKSGNKIKDWDTTASSEGWIMNLQLTNKAKYSFMAKAQNKAGLWSTTKESSGITTDTGILCDVTCGGACEPCPAGEACKEDADCESSKCVSEVCEAASCSDSIKNGNESDVDCGGACDGCAKSRSCSSHGDCASGLSCVSGKCNVVEHCTNNKKDADESDIDCGGLECNTCEKGKKCMQEEDCSTGQCHKNTCVKKGDIDSDGVGDSEDNCHEKANANQKDADKDSIGDACDEDADGDALTDEWETRYFNSTAANPDGDPDEDGLTNKEEQEKGTDPNEKDTDGDGHTDKTEIEKGYDPLDKKSHPGSGLWKWAAALMLLAAIGFLVYKKKPSFIKPPAQKQKNMHVDGYMPPQPPQVFRKHENISEKRRDMLEKFKENEIKDVFEKLRHKRQSFKK